MRQLLACVLAVGMFSCIGDNYVVTDCNDGVDNDGDGYADSADPGCGTSPWERSDEGLARCQNGYDDDGDGMADFPLDPGCRAPNSDLESDLPAPQCSDHRDNDGDGKTDYPEDPGCIAPQQNDELDDCPNGPGCPQCSNGIDDDSNGTHDYPRDLGCTAASDREELWSNPAACGNATFLPLPTSGVVLGKLEAGPSRLASATCGGTGPEVIYELRISQPAYVTISTDSTKTTADTVVYLRGLACASPQAELMCNDDISHTKVSSSLAANLAPGVYFIIVDGQNASTRGNFELTVTKRGTQGATCIDTDGCAAGLQCRVPAGQTRKQCSLPTCSDGVDDDNDGHGEYPTDPGCDSALDASEEDGCGTGGVCPACGNADDDDQDGSIDYPADPDCSTASQVSERTCPNEQDPVTRIEGPVTIGEFLTSTKDDLPSNCGPSGRDLVFALNVPKLTSLTAHTKGSTYSNPLLTLWPSSCAGAGQAQPLACNDNDGSDNQAKIVMAPLAAGAYALAVDARSATGVGKFQLTVEGVIAPGESCASPLYTQGVLRCDDGYVCKGPEAGRTCQPAQCADGDDNDGDSRSDFPNDPGCTHRSDDDEADDCPSGPHCPVCSNGSDDDNDGLFDFPADTTCPSASGHNETCNVSEAVPLVTTAVFQGDTRGATNDFEPECERTSGPDLAFELDLPELKSLKIDLGNQAWDGIEMLMNTTCNQPSLVCTSTNALTRSTLAAGRYFYVIDSSAPTIAGAFTATISGEIAPQGSCDVALAHAGALTCSFGYACGGDPGQRRCLPTACNDGIDNDGDNRIDVLQDPGCLDIGDNDETDACPGDAACPECSNGVDDDGDGKKDYPEDTKCRYAGQRSESMCPIERDPIEPILTSVVRATLVGANDDMRPSCGGTGGAERGFVVELPAMTRFAVDVSESSIADTTVALYDQACANALTCADDDESGRNPTMVKTNLAAGTYIVSVGAFSNNTTPDAITLRIEGTIARGGACTSPLATAGVINCVTGTRCLAGTCQ